MCEKFAIYIANFAEIVTTYGQFMAQNILWCCLLYDAAHM